MFNDKHKIGMFSLFCNQETSLKMFIFFNPDLNLQSFYVTAGFGYVLVLCISFGGTLELAVDLLFGVMLLH